jgi:hypothetical protein
MSTPFPSQRRLLKPVDAELILAEVERYLAFLLAQKADFADESGHVDLTLRVHVHDSRISGVTGGLQGIKRRE